MSWRNRDDEEQPAMTPRGLASFPALPDVRERIRDGPDAREAPSRQPSALRGQPRAKRRDSARCEAARVRMKKS